MADLYLRQNDVRTVTRTLRDGAGVVIDLTNAASGVFSARRIDSGAVVINRAALTFVVPRTGGQVSLPFTALHLATATALELELEITWSDGQIWTFPSGATYTVLVQDDIA